MSEDKPIVEYPAHEMFPGLWLGDSHAAMDEHFVRSKNINTIVNCTTNCDFIEINGVDLITHRIPVKDNLEDSELLKLYHNMDHCTEYINKQLMLGHRILVNCHAGRQRSVAVVLGYLMKYCNMSCKEALALVQTKRPVAGYPSLNFSSSLKLYERDLKMDQ